MRKGWEGWWPDAAGPMQKPTGNYYLVQIRKHSLFKFDGSRWVKLGDYANRDEALQSLEDEVETMEIIENESISSL